MHLCAASRVVATLFLAFFAGQILGFITPPQTILSQPCHEPSIKISILRSKITFRMIEHKTIIAANFEAVSSTLANITSSFDKSTLALSKFKSQLPDIQEEQMKIFLNDVFQFLRINGGHLKQGFNHSLDNIIDSLTRGIKEFDDMEHFLCQALEEVSILENEILNDNACTQDASSTEYFKPVSYKYPSIVISNDEDGEKENLQAMFKHIVEQQLCAPDTYPCLCTQMVSPNTTPGFEYSATFRSVLLYKCSPRSYSCDGTVRARFEHSGSVEYEDFLVKCESLIPGEAAEIGTLFLSATNTSVWSEHD